jgi:hypothetical protein
MLPATGREVRRKGAAILPLFADEKCRLSKCNIKVWSVFKAQEIIYVQQRSCADVNSHRLGLLELRLGLDSGEAYLCYVCLCKGWVWIDVKLTSAMSACVKVGFG